MTYTAIYCPDNAEITNGKPKPINILMLQYRSYTMMKISTFWPTTPLLFMEVAINTSRKFIKKDWYQALLVMTTISRSFIIIWMTVTVVFDYARLQWWEPKMEKLSLSLNNLKIIICINKPLNLTFTLNIHYLSILSL